MDRYGLEIFDNQIFDNSVNGLFVRINTPFGSEINKLDVPGIFNDDITHVITENLQIYGAPGGQLDAAGNPTINGRLKINPGTVVKLSGSRIEAERGSAQLIAEGTEENPIIFTSLSDDRYGAGTTFDTSNDGVTAFGPGNWGGIIFNAASSGSIDHALITNAGGLTPIEGGFDNFNAIEVHQADFRLTNSVLEDNANGRSNSNRNGRGFNGSATVFVRGAQPIIVDNIFQDNAGTVISIDANALNYKLKSDYGRSTGFTDAYQQYPDNHGALVRLNRMENNGLNGMEVRPALLDTETIWDDTDIVHILRGEILVNQHHTFSGIRLQSNLDEGLVVKLDGPTAGFTADGVPLDIDDRIGGTVQIIGQPGFPVILTSLADDSVGASFTPAGLPQTDTNNDGGASTPSAGDWRSIRLDRYSNDRNVVVRFETEGNNTSGVDVNNNPGFAQNLGVLAPDEISGDENRALGFHVQGSISADAPDDVDVYSFNATAGTRIWVDIDRTASALDSVVELIDIFGNVLASSLDSFNLATLSGLAEDLTQTPHLLGDFYSQNKGDAGFSVILPGSVGIVGTYFVRVRSQPVVGDEANVTGGQTSGQYQLQIRLRQVDEKPGSTVRFADIRFATNGIEILGQPSHSPLLGESSEKTGTNETIDNAQGLGNLLTSDRNTLAVSGTLSNGSDVDWYTFEMGYDLIQVIGGRSDGGKTFSTIFDIDYADGLTRADTTLSIFDDQGRLILISRDSDVEDDQANGDTEDLSSGSFGKLDPYIGSAQLPAATPGSTFRYHIAVSSNQRLPQALNATFNSSALNAQIRLEPVSSVQRIVEDHIGFSGYTSGNSLAGGTSQVDPTTPRIFDIIDTTVLATHVTAFTLADVSLYISQGNRLRIADAYDGRVVDSVGGVPVPTNTIDVGALSAGNPTTSDITIRSDGQLYSYESLPGVQNSIGRLRELNPGTGGTISSFNDGIPNIPNNGQTDPVQLTSDTVGALAFQRTNVATYNLFYAVNDGANTTIYQANPANGDAGDNKLNNGNPTNATFTERGDITGFGHVTGMSYRGINASASQSQLYAVTDTGQFLTISQSGGTRREVTGVTAVDLSGQISGTFTGLTAAPQNLNNGAFRNFLFAITDTGNLYAIDPATGTILTQVTDPDPNVGTIDIFSGGGTSINVGASGVTGLAFSPLDFNLWHPTFQRNSDAGHGINNTFDQTRTDTGGNNRDSYPEGREHSEQQGGASFYFGFEDWVDNNNGNVTNAYIDYVTDAQYGVMSEAFQRDLSSNPDIGDNYNIAGGAHGSLESGEFSLDGYSATDLPTLYFNYFLESQNANSLTNGMRDSARVFITNDDGATWTELATNNSTLAPATDPNSGELSSYITTSEREGVGNANQRVQELFDNTGVWRQARIDLGSFAGDANLRLRFDFSTSGTISSDIDMPGDGFGNPISNQQAQNNNFEGFYIDDIIIGFAERGELVTGSQTDQTDFFNVPQNPTFGAPTQLLSGAYQLEIRRGTDYAAPPNGQLPDLVISTQFDTNDRLVREIIEAGDTLNGQLGDRNLERQQGHISIESNTITSSSEYGINIDAGQRELVAAGPNGGVSARSQAGGVINGPTLNNFFSGGLGFAPGVTVHNNVLSDFTNGSGGLRISGDANSSNLNNPAAVSYTKVVNNTVVGTNDAGRAGEGIRVENFATATILNNIVAYTAIGIDLQSAAGIPNVVGANLFKENDANGTLGSNPIELNAAEALFVDAAIGNFYLADRSEAIDSSLNSLADRPAFVNVKDAIGMPNSDIFAPNYDAFGQLRVDDPTQTPPPGLGSNIFKDRGAIERADFVGPTAIITLPDDNDANGVDLNNNLTEVYISNPELFTTMIVELQDTGIGIDDRLVNSLQFTLTAETSSTAQTTLVEGTDYLFSYNSNTNEAIFTSIVGVFSLDTLYTIDVDNSSLTGVKDLAGNSLQPNQTDLTTSFTIVVTDGVNDPPVHNFNGAPMPDAPNVSATTDAEVPIVFSFNNGNRLTITDVDAFLGTGEVEVTLTTVNGTLTLGSTNNLVFSVGTGLGNETTMTFTGLLDDVNAALEGTIWTPDAGYYSSLNLLNPATITLSTSDLANFDGSIATGDGAGSQTDVDVIDITVNDPPTVQFSSATYSVSEDGSSLNVTLTRNATAAPSTVQVTLADNTATSPDDYDNTPFTVTFAANQTTAIVVIPIIDDSLVEADETIDLTIIPVDNALLGTQNTAQVTIIDNDQAVLTVTNVTDDEANGPFTFTVMMSNSVDRDVSFSFATADGTATIADLDYNQVNLGDQTLTFNANTSTLTQTFTIDVNDDVKVELDEFFNVFLGNLVVNNINGHDVVLGPLGSNNEHATGTIQNDDQAVLSVDDVSALESTGQLVFTVSLSHEVAGDISVLASTQDGTATTGDNDYVSSNQTITFLEGGSLTQNFTVTVNNDDTVELDETISAVLSNLNANGFNVIIDTLGGDTGTGTIENDDSATFTISDVTANETNGPFVFVVTMSNAVDVDVTVDIETVDGTALVSDNDYTEINIGDQPLTFVSGGSQSQVFTVDITNDSKVELDEIFTTILNNLNAGGRDVSIAGAVGTGTIVNDDQAVISIGNVSQFEDADAGAGAGIFTFTVSMSNLVDVDISVDVATQDGTATTADNDYTPIVLGDQTILFTSGGPSLQAFEVQVTVDNIVELDETFNTILGNLVTQGRNVILGTNGTGVIRNDDSAEITIDNVSDFEPNGPFTFTATLSNPVDSDISFDISTQDGTATAADNDFTAIINQLINFTTGGSLTQTFTVDIIDDSKVELDEIFNVVMGNLVNTGRNVTLGTPAEGTIVNDDSATLTINNISDLESNGPFTFTVTLSNEVDTDISVDAVTQDGTATAANGDYTALFAGDRVITFVSGDQLTQTFTVDVADENLVEADEIFSALLDLASLQNGGRNVSIINGGGEATIRNDDSATLSITPVIDTEANSPFQFLVELSNPVDVAITVDASTVDGTAISPADFLEIIGQTLTFNAGETAQFVNVTVNQDIDPEIPETFEVILENLNPNGRAVFLTSIAARSSSVTSDAAVAVDVVGDFAYIADRDGGLQIFNIADPSNPFHVGAYDFNQQGIAQAIDVVGNLAYLAVGEAGLQILDISDPTNPTFVGSIATPARARGVQVIGNLAYVADDSGNGGGLQIVDVSTPSTPVLVGSFGVATPGGLAGGVQVIGNIAYVTDGNNGLQIVDVSIPTSPTQIHNVATPGGAAIGLDVVGNFAYVANREGGLQIIDISTPATASIVGSFDTTGIATGVRIVGNFAYVADGAEGLQIIDITNPTTPTFANMQDTPGSARSLDVAGTLAFIADTFSGLQILEFFPSVTATGTILDPAGPPLTGTASANTTISTSLVTTPTSTTANGETSTVPESEQWIDEWDSFWVEVWGNTSDGSGISGGTFDLEYNTDYFSATVVEYGSAFANSTSSTIDDQTGIVSGITGQNNLGTLGSTDQVLLARIKFESLADDGVSIDNATGFLGPHSLGIRVTNTQLDISGFGGVTASVAQSPTTDLWAVPFDLDDSGSINFRDLMTFASFYGTSVVDATSGLAWSLDFDKSGAINFKDLTYLATNYNLTKDSGQQVIFPSNFPQEWYGPQLSTNGEDSLNDLIDAAVNEWKTATGNDELAVQVVVTDLGGQQLGEGHILELDENGIPVKGRVYIDDDAAGLGWYSSVEGLAFDSNGQAIAGSAAEGHYDLYTVLLHEIGHAAGFTTSYSAFSDHLATNGSGQVQFVGWDFVAPLTDDGLHIDNTFYPDDIMGATLDPATRKMISTLDAQILQTAYDNAAGAVITPLAAPLMASAIATPVDNTTPSTEAAFSSTKIVPARVQSPQTTSVRSTQQATLVESVQQSEWEIASSLMFSNSVMTIEKSDTLEQLAGSLIEVSYETEPFLSEEFGKIKTEDALSRFDFAHDFEFDDVTELEMVDDEVDNLFTDWTGPLV